ncbi:MAG: chitobiase/beta-hexosaminidase C-terminal domain-containing protein, partial [Pontiellaceae bacterium]|nr:chitobiase/beta-hexosaminidase C-terminal domain-containing protein [Pontiellaceae bacterium]
MNELKIAAGGLKAGRTMPLRSGLLSVFTRFLLMLTVIAGVFFTPPASPAGVIINEFMSSNGATLVDEDGEFEDWIELFNPGTNAVDLTDWGLSDNTSSPFKWRFPANTIIAPAGYLVVRASGKDRLPGAELPGIFREVWLNISGTSVSNLTNNAAFPDNPDSRNRIIDFIETPSYFADNYGQRLRGILTAPDTGSYRFWIASDDRSELRLSTNESPVNLTRIARVSGSTSLREWDKYTSQQSSNIFLVAGRKYFIEILMKAGTGSDHLAVRWQLPDGAIEEPMPAHYVTSPTTGQLHTNFRISSSGEPLIFTRPDSVTADQIPPVYVPRDISYGRLTDGAADWHYFAETTPGESNTSTPVILPPVVTISEPHGFRDAPFTVSLSASEPGAVIRYTLDGSTPNASSPVYTNPISITGTATLRASAIEPGMISLPPATATWLFIDDILQQSAVPPPGWPASYEINEHKMEYGMLPEIVTNDNQRLRDGLKSIPSISLVTDLGNLFATNTGIYSYSNKSYGWERPVSVELIDSDGNPDAEFQIDAGLSLRGAFSRNVNNPKHSLRLFFRSGYGDRSLEFPLFGDEGTSTFDKIDLSTAQNYSWSYTNDYRNTFVREIFSRDSQRDTGMPYTRSRYYHLYLNGQYWGLYLTQERGEADWAATYLGGDSDDWDTIKTSQPGYVTQAADGNFTAFYTLHNIAVNQGFAGTNANNYWRIRGLNPDGTPNLSFPVLLDEDNLIHYMLIAHYTGDNDSPVSVKDRPNNLDALFNRITPDGFKWLRHDAEHSLGARDTVYLDTTAMGSTLTSQSQFNPAIL